MLPLAAGSEANSGVGAFVYERHCPERTLLYQLVQDYYPAFKTHLAAQGSALPAYVEREFEDYLRCGRLEHGFMRTRWDSCHAEQPVRQWVLSVPLPLRCLFASHPAVMGQVLGIVYRCIATHLTKKAGCARETAQTGVVTLIQRFGSALNLNIHFHLLFLDGVYVDRPDGALRFGG